MEVNPTNLNIHMKVVKVGEKTWVARDVYKWNYDLGTDEFEDTLHEDDEENDVYVANEDEEEGRDDR